MTRESRRVAGEPETGSGNPFFERRVLIWMCVLIAVNQLGFGSVVPTLPLYAKSFGVSASAIGLAVAVYGLARFVVAMPTGHLCDRLGRRPTLAIGGVVSTLGNLWCAEAAGFSEFIVARFLAGAGAGLVLTAGQVVLADITTPARRGRTMAIYHGVFIFAVGIGPFPGGLLADHLGLAAPFRAYGAVGILVSILAWFAVGETRRLSYPQRGRGWSHGPTLISQMRMLAAQIGFVLVCLVGLVNALVRTGGLFNIIPVLGSVRLGLSVTEIGGGLALGSVIGLAIAYPAGMLVDRFGRKAVVVPGTMLAGFSLLMFCFAPTYPWFTAACVLWGAAMSVGGSAPVAYAADLAPSGMNATAMSTFRMVSDFGYVIGPIVLGLLVDGYGSITALVAAAGLTILVGMAFRAFAPETHRNQDPRR
ncbi:MAG: MFS transporter [Immundisolibacterales bacterium]|nr:MFS transporter [Immundisolibacterales bacterium]